ncbi:MAG: DUF1735 domain-containing protein [Bacteroides sp.]|nr:DUF1735 domain-containing protein [Bacteroides sp.]
MKKILFIMLAGVFFFGCTNKDIEFDDYQYQSIFFPYQMPIRTLVLGDEAVGDNSIDREHAFSIGVTMGGVYENDKNREITVAYAPELTENMIDAATGDTLKLLPESYYDAAFKDASSHLITIPAGQMSGKTRIDLRDAFFQDPLTAEFHYVIPLRIIEAGQDTILSGLPGPGQDMPDPRNPDHWNLLPKDYTLFGIRYTNEVHGYYLYRGQRRNTSTDEITSYSERFLTDNPLTLLATRALDENIMGRAAGFATDETFRMLLDFNHNNQTLTVSQVDTASAEVNGTGIYFTKDDADSESYNGNKHRSIYLEYTYMDGTDSYAVNDSLVFVDTDVRFEEYTVTIYEP